MRERKQLDVTLDPSKEGTFTATIATLNTIDHDNDVTLPGAFKEGQAVRIARYGHNWGELPVGKGVIRATDQKAGVEGAFFLNTQYGKDTYLTIKELGDLQEWSYGYDVTDSEAGQFEGKDVRFLKALDVIEVSPVMLGAGIGTRTENIKGLKFADHAQTLLDDVDAFITRARDLKTLRAKEGRTLSDANRTRLSGLLESWTSGIESLRALLEETDPKRTDADPKAELAMLRLRQLRDEARELGLITIS